MVNYTSALNRPPTPAQLQQINAFKARKAAAFGGDYQAYLDSKKVPMSPTERALDSLKRSSVGDKGYEAEQIVESSFYKNADKKFWAANPKYFHPDGRRKYSDPEDQAAWDRMQNKNKPAVISQPPKVETPAPAPKPAPTPAFQLPTMMAPPPGQRHLLFNGANFGGNRNSYLNSAFGGSPAFARQQQGLPIQQPLAQNVGPRRMVDPVRRLQLQSSGMTNQNMQQPTGGIPMPSNLNRYYQLQAGNQQTPYAHLIDQHAKKINRRQGNAAGLNVGITPFSFNAAGFNAPVPQTDNSGNNLAYSGSYGARLAQLMNKAKQNNMFPTSGFPKGNPADARFSFGSAFNPPSLNVSKRSNFTTTPNFFNANR